MSQNLKSAGGGGGRSACRNDGSEFMGFFGNLMMMVALPILVTYLHICMIGFDFDVVKPLFELSSLPSLYSDHFMPSRLSFAIYGGWFFFQAFLFVLLPGYTATGLPSPVDGSKLKYKMNGILALPLSVGLFVGAWWYKFFSAQRVIQLLPSLMTTSMFFALAMSIFLYVKASVQGFVGLRSGNFIVDFFMGSELNPRLFDFDFKFFCESRPGLIGWAVLELAVLLAHFEKYSSLSAGVVLAVVGPVFYVADYFWVEEAILSTMDIMSERFGFMLTFGDLVWVPFTYTIAALYHVEHVPSLNALETVAISAILITGYILFRGSNNQKHQFRTKPETMPNAQFIRTKRGTNLICSGFWGMARHINYTGDILMGLAWCLPCRFESLLPFFYFLYFVPLLVHREYRDNHHCHLKYGQDWVTYCKRVPYRMIPGVY